MTTEFRDGTLSDLVEIQRGHDLTEPERRPGSVPVLGSAGPNGFHDRAIAPGPGVVIGRSGASFGQVSYTPVPYWPHNTVLYVTDFKGNEPRYVYYCLKAMDFSHFNSGSAQQSLNRNYIYGAPLRIADPSSQRAIAKILGALDDKIELNRWMNETLEAMARALFKSWFVDFDPVRAKAEGRDRGLPNRLADLFPGRLVDSEFGEIPEGWEIKSLDQIARFVNGLALQKYPPTGDESLPVIKIAQLRSGTTEAADRATSDLEPDCIVADGDILFSWSGSLECVLWAGGPGALNQHLFKVTSAEYPRWLCYFAVHQHLDEFRHIAAGKATTMGHIQRHHLSDAKVVVPPSRLLGAMGEFVSPMFENLWKRNVESRTVRMIRDTLLPKLISGELRVKGAEKGLERMT